MAKTLVIVESPTKSKTIEKFLGKNYTVKASMGHLRDLPKSTLGVTFLPDEEHANEFEPKYINIRGKGDLIKALKTEAKKADKVLLATDPDREGEAISWHLAFILGIDPTSACRIEFHEITAAAVKDAIKHPRCIDMDMVDAQQARRILDRIVGYQLSPLLWRKIRKGLSAGRVQSVATKIVADRDREIEDFVPVEYWTLSAKLREGSKGQLFEAEAVKYKGKKLELHNEAEARAAEEALSKADYIVSDAVKKERKRHPVPPFTTSSMQQEANKKLNFSAKKTMMLAQQLYEGVSLGKTSVGLITYMRTDSVRLAEVAIAEIRDYIKQNIGSEFCPAKENHYSTKKNAQDAHEAIRPTSVMRTPAEMQKYLTNDQLKLYTLIWNRVVASQMTDAVYDVTTLTIDAADYQLRATGSVLKFPGFLQLHSKYDDKEKDSKVPYVEPGSKLLLYKLMPAEQHFTEPPAHFTEATLIKELEEKGIGRPSTFAPTIVTLLTRGYVVKEAKKLLVTELGIMTVDMLTEYFKGLINIGFTAQMEEKLDEVAEKKHTKDEVLSEFYGPFKKDLDHAGVAIPIVEIPLEVSDVPCDKCNDGTMMVIREGRFGKFLACPNFPKCRNTKPILHPIGVKCPKCGADILERKSKTGKVFYGCEKYPECDYTTWDKPLNEKCPDCGAMMVEHVERNGSKRKFCSNPECSKARPVYASKTAAAKTTEAKTTATKKTTAAKKTTAKKTTATKTTAAKKTTATKATTAKKTATAKKTTVTKKTTTTKKGSNE
ncbi:type I DNA topoisomerase [Phascolarctobacterium succinatutens]|jgi:DNA topoisomerase-1|uniref:type I DNA topoisomerase n=3 Tax=Phascolarctobacterium succinatutens TaxID=626940 RepID=UPI00201B484A|nr:type I DNA topoisomerase [Phascolarctobacterium succinatutens]UQT41008.1 type I DNA topoisomerase [Phascolarctobacterium succinatutens]